jgi:hypothetical protein
VIVISIELSRLSASEIEIRIVHDGHHHDVRARRFPNGWLASSWPNALTAGEAAEAVRLALERHPFLLH